jgi:single-strand DNA-binding protein
MSGSVNKVIIVGNLGRDPEIRATNNGRVCNLSVATSQKWRDKRSNEMQEVIWNEHLVDVAERFLTKGSTVYLQGMLQTRKWTDQQGAERFSTEVVLPAFQGELVLLGGTASQSHSEPAPRRRAAPSPSRTRQAQVEDDDYDDLNDDIPF